MSDPTFSRGVYSNLFSYSREGDFGGVRSEVHSRGDTLSLSNLFTAVTFATSMKHEIVANYLLDTIKNRLNGTVDESTLEDASMCLFHIYSYYILPNPKDYSDVPGNLISTFGLPVINYTLRIAHEVRKEAEERLDEFYSYYGSMSPNEWSEDPTHYHQDTVGAEKTITYLLKVREEMTRDEQKNTEYARLTQEIRGHRREND